MARRTILVCDWCGREEPLEWRHEHKTTDGISWYPKWGNLMLAIMPEWQKGNLPDKYNYPEVCGNCLESVMLLKEQIRIAKG